MKNKKIIIGIIAAIAVIAIAVFGIRAINNNKTEDPVDNPGTVEPANPDDNVTPGEKQSIVMYIPDEQMEALQPVGTEVDAGSDQAIVDALVAAKALPDGCEVLSCKLEDTQLALDMNITFGNAVRSSGTAGETLMIYALVDTFAQCYGAETVLVTVEGGVFETGHEVYDTAIMPDYNI